MHPLYTQWGWHIFFFFRCSDDIMLSIFTMKWWNIHNELLYNSVQASSQITTEWELVLVYYGLKVQSSSWHGLTGFTVNKELGNVHFWYKREWKVSVGIILWIYIPWNARKLVAAKMMDICCLFSRRFEALLICQIIKPLKIATKKAIYSYSILFTNATMKLYSIILPIAIILWSISKEKRKTQFYCFSHALLFCSL